MGILEVVPHRTVGKTLMTGLPTEAGVFRKGELGVFAIDRLAGRDTGDGYSCRDVKEETGKMLLRRPEVA